MGPKDFTRTAFLGGLYLNGAFYRGAGGYTVPAGFSSSGGAVTFPTSIDGIEQHLWAGGDVPLNLHRRETIRMRYRLLRQADADRVEELATLGVAVRVWADLWVTDWWYIPGANAAQATWRTSRELPWNLAGITHATRPPEALLVSAAGARTALTVITAGTPVAGQIKIPETGGALGDLETEPVENLTDTYLLVRYPGVMRAKLTEFSRDHRSFNHVDVAFTLAEVAAGTGYTVAA